MQNFTTKEENPSEFSRTAKAPPQRGLVKASITPGYNTSINIRFVPGRDFDDLVAIPKTCKPRNGKRRSGTELLDLPEKLVAKLIESDKQVIAWLAENEANTRLFLSDPASALKKAGIDLTRAEQKHLHRTHQEVSQSSVIGPGVKVDEINTAVFPDGRIGQIKPGRKPTDNGSNSCVREV